MKDDQGNVVEDRKEILQLADTLPSQLYQSNINNEDFKDANKDERSNMCNDGSDLRRRNQNSLRSE